MDAIVKEIGLKNNCGLTNVFYIFVNNRIVNCRRLVRVKNLGQEFCNIANFSDVRCCSIVYGYEFECYVRLGWGWG